MSMFRFIVSTCVGEGAQQVFDLDAQACVVGRDAAAAVYLPHPAVSAEHLRVEREQLSGGPSVQVVDPGSTNGTTVQGAPLTPGVPRVLADGDRIVVGEVFVLVYVEQSPSGVEVTGADRTAAIAHQLVQELLASGALDAPAATPVDPVLVGELGAAKGERHPLSSSECRLVFGRGSTSTVTVIDPDLSREHFEVRRTLAGVTVADLGSKNGTELDGSPLCSYESVPLIDGARVQAGGCVYRFVDPATSYLRQLAALADDAPPNSASDPQAMEASSEVPAGPVSGQVHVPEKQAPAPEKVPSGGGVVSRILLALLVVGAIAGLVWLSSV